MRTILLITVLLSVAALKAQTVMSAGFAGFTPGKGIANNIFAADSFPKKQWSFSRFGGISTSFTFFKGGNATIVSAPMGLQLNRMLNNNLYAFASIAVAPAYVNFNPSFITTLSKKSYPGSFFSGPNHARVYSAASMGLMYINNDKTFSISGRISVERSITPLPLVYPASISGPIPFSRTIR